MPSLPEREREIVVIERDGLRISIVQQSAGGVVESISGGYVYASLRPLAVRVETPGSRVVHTLHELHSEQQGAVS